MGQSGLVGGRRMMSCTHYPGLLVWGLTHGCVLSKEVEGIDAAEVARPRRAVFVSLAGYGEREPRHKRWRRVQSGSGVLTKRDGRGDRKNR